MERKIVARIRQRMDLDELVLLTGARQTGKTTAIRQIMGHLTEQGLDAYYLTLEDPEYLRILNGHPDNIWQLVPRNDKARIYVLIDEIQYLDNPTNFLKYHYDLNRRQLKLIVTGSSGFYLDKRFNDSLAGRKKLYTLPTLSFEEFLEFKQRPDLAALIAALDRARPDLSGIPLIRRREILALSNEYLTYGGYPAVVLAPTTAVKQELLFELFSSYLKRDFSESGIANASGIYHLLKLLAYQTGSEVNKSRLATEVGVNRISLDNMLYVLQKTFHVELVNPFFSGHPKELRKMPKLYFMDLGMRNAVLRNYGPPADRADRGELYENYIYRFFSDSITNAEIQYWRTQGGNEVDFIIGGNKAYEVKWNGRHLNPKRYELFRNTYPELDLRFVARENSEGCLLL